MSRLQKLLYTAKTHTIGGREGASRSSDGHLDVQLSRPGGPGVGTNPEQLFGAGWSASFQNAMGLAAHSMKVELPSDLGIDAEIDLWTRDGEFFLQARLKIHLPGVERDVAQVLADAAHRTCPYSKALREDMDVTINLI